MTPSNTPITPQINNIADSGGNKHTVVPSNHTHSQSEVDGLTAALAGKIGIVSSPTAGHLPKLKSDGALEDSGIPINNLATQADLANINMSLAQKLGMFNMQQSVAGHLPVITSLGRLEDSGKGLSDLQTKLTFDTTPTSNSTNPVTSGGVKAALDGKEDIAPKLRVLYSLVGGTKILTEEQQGDLEKFISQIWDYQGNDMAHKMEIECVAQDISAIAQCSYMFHLFTTVGHDKFAFAIVLNNDVYQVNGTVDNYQEGIGFHLDSNHLTYIDDIFDFQMHAFHNNFVH